MNIPLIRMLVASVAVAALLAACGNPPDPKRTTAKSDGVNANALATASPVPLVTVTPTETPPPPATMTPVPPEPTATPTDVPMYSRTRIPADKQLPLDSSKIETDNDGKFRVRDQGDGCEYVQVSRGVMPVDAMPGPDGPIVVERDTAILKAPGCDIFYRLDVQTGGTHTNGSDRGAPMKILLFALGLSLGSLVALSSTQPAAALQARFDAAAGDVLALIARLDDATWRKKVEWVVGRVSAVDLGSWVVNHNVAHQRQIGTLAGELT